MALAVQGFMPGVRPIKTYRERLLKEQAPAPRLAMCFCMAERLLVTHFLPTTNARMNKL